MRYFLKVAPMLFFWGIFIFVVLQVPYPENLPQANITAAISFFVPLFLALSLTINLLFQNIFLSASISLGLVSLLILKALDSLNLVTGVLIIIIVALLISYFRKSERRSLTNHAKIPGLKSFSRKRP